MNNNLKVLINGIIKEKSYVAAGDVPHAGNYKLSHQRHEHGPTMFVLVCSNAPFRCLKPDSDMVRIPAHMW